jgi:hypothetical protein
MLTPVEAFESCVVMPVAKPGRAAKLMFVLREALCRFTLVAILVRI